MFGVQMRDDKTEMKEGRKRDRYRARSKRTPDKSIVCQKLSLFVSLGRAHELTTTDDRGARQYVEGFERTQDIKENKKKTH